MHVKLSDTLVSLCFRTDNETDWTGSATECRKLERQSAHPLGTVRLAKTVYNTLVHLG